MSGIADRIADICEGYFKYLESDGYYPAGCNGDELAKRLVAELGLQEISGFGRLVDGTLRLSCTDGTASAHRYYRTRWERAE